MLKLGEFTVYTEELNELLKEAEKIVKGKKTKTIFTINAHSYVTTKDDQQFKEALRKADIIIPDGASISVATKLFNKKPKISHRIPGPDFFEAFNKIANKKKLTYFFMGANKKTLKLIKDRLKKEHPDIKVHTHAPGWYPFPEKENNDIIKKINKAKPHVLWVGMTAPKQEKWCAENKNKLKAKLICPIGAAFDFYAGTLKRAPKSLQKINAEWLYRLYKEPRRTYKRYIHNNIRFAYHMLND